MTTNTLSELDEILKIPAPWRPGEYREVKARLTTHISKIVEQERQLARAEELERLMEIVERKGLTTTISIDRIKDRLAELRPKITKSGGNDD